MKTSKSYWVLFGVIAAVAAAAAIVTGAVVLALPGGDDSTDTLVSTGLLAASRERLGVCVQGVAGVAVDTDKARKQVQAALGEVTSHPLWEAGVAGNQPPIVGQGCPSQPYLLRPGVSYGGKPIGDPAVQRVDTASAYRVFIFVLPPQKLTEVFGDPQTAIRVEPQEFLCEGEVCAEVSTGLYVAPQELADSGFLKDWLNKALGLEPLVPEEEQPEVPGQR